MSTKKYFSHNSYLQINEDSAQLTTNLFSSKQRKRSVKFAVGHQIHMQKLGQRIKVHAEKGSFQAYDLDFRFCQSFKGSLLNFYGPMRGSDTKIHQFLSKA